MKHMIRISLVVLLGLLLYRPAVAQIAVGISVRFAPPALPVYELPACPGDGYMWTPGYWGWDADDNDYYWVPGTWVMAPQPGLLWTPAWWGWEGGAFAFHDGFWATEVGWYGGINYGFGYWGHGFWGGRWEGGRFMYNRAVIRVTNVHNVYEDKTVIVNNRGENRVSYNGGQGGVTERPTDKEEGVSRLQHFPPARPQEDNVRAARSNPQMRASNNRGKPEVAATAHAGEFSGHDVVKAKAAGGEYHPPAERGEKGGERGAALSGGAGNPGHARDLQAHQAPEGGTPDSKTQKMIDKQNQEHQKLQKQQEKEDQKADQQKWNDQRKQQMEQRHQQQTQKMEQRHQQQMQRVGPKPKPQ
ncbi:MAG TPA: YXWGXW repeat-containing protein [Terracidiphilus sp.]|jgi:hypothetical protein